MTIQAMRQLHLSRIFLTGLAVFALVFVSATTVITGYATVLAFKAQAAPDSGKISQFASQAAPWITAVSSVLFAFVAGAWAARRVANRAALHGLLIAGVAAVCGVAYGAFLSSLAWHDAVAAIGMLAAGWYGGRQAANRTKAA